MLGVIVYALSKGSYSRVAGQSSNTKMGECGGGGARRNGRCTVHAHRPMCWTFGCHARALDLTLFGGTRIMHTLL